MPLQAPITQSVLYPPCKKIACVPPYQKSGQTLSFRLDKRDVPVQPKNLNMRNWKLNFQITSFSAWKEDVPVQPGNLNVRNWKLNVPISLFSAWQKGCTNTTQKSEYDKLEIELWNTIISCWPKGMYQYNPKWWSRIWEWTQIQPEPEEKLNTVIPEGESSKCNFYGFKKKLLNKNTRSTLFHMAN